MAGHIVQHLAECQEDTVIVVPDFWAYWFPFVPQAIRRATVLAAVAERPGQGRKSKIADGFDKYYGVPFV
ncbi:unnamed protein product [Laminaria digitata]